jgi:hypothetical protein
LNNPYLQSIFNLCADKNKFVYEVSPIFGDGFTIEEMHYWWIYNTIAAARFYNIEHTDKDIEWLTEEIQAEKSKREMEALRNK